MINNDGVGIIHMGWGVKIGKNVKNLKRRWFVLLSTGELKYFVDKMAITAQGQVQINYDTVYLFSNTRQFILVSKHKKA